MVGQISITRPKRWDKPFDPNMTDKDVERVLTLPILKDIDASRFRPPVTLRDILRNDSRIRRYRRGDIVFRDGEYGNSVCLIMKGTVRVLQQEKDLSAMDRFLPSQKRTVYEALSQLWRNPKMPEVRDPRIYDAPRGDGVRRTGDNEANAYIKDVDDFLEREKTIVMSEGEMVGEIAALTRSTRTATVVADDDAEMLELRWQGLRDIRSRDEGVKKYVDSVYRANALSHQLAETPLFRHLDEATLALVSERTLFETHGVFEWFGGFKSQLFKMDSRDMVEGEPIIVEEGHHLNGLLIVCAGFGRISQRLGSGHRTLGYACKKDVFGLEEIVAHWRHGDPLVSKYSLRALGYTDALWVPTALIEEHVLPNVPRRLLPAISRGKGEIQGRRLWTEPGEGQQLEQSTLDFFVDHRIINGTATMLINTNRCIGCDECVRACAKTHNNNPRFVRHGPELGNVMVANACMHCVDAVCLIGCPTGAIHRNLEDGRVIIDDVTCIGCGTCANSCPYDNIRLVEIRDEHGGFIIDEDSKEPVVKATKCDLCLGQLGGPSCQRACPHDALVRLDMRDRDTLSRWINQ